MVAKLLEHLDRGSLVALQRHVGDDRLSRRRVGPATDSGLCDFWMIDEGRLDLDRRESMTGDVHHVVDPAEQPEVTVFIYPRAVACEVVPREARPVRLAEPRVVTEDPTHHRGPGPLEHEVAASLLDALPLLVQHRCLDTGERPRRRAWLRGRHAWQRRDQHHPGLRLPPRVDDGAALATDVAVVPHPGLRVDRLSDRPEQP